jgi:MIP family channel proteins
MSKRRNEDRKRRADERRRRAQERRLRAQERRERGGGPGRLAAPWDAIAERWRAIAERPRRERDATEAPEERDTPAYVAEFIGTFFLVVFVCLILSVNSGKGLGFTDFAVIGLVHFFVLAMIVYTLGATSGAHVNPAVTAALAALRKITLIDAVIYWLVQLAGGVAGALVCRLLLVDIGRSVNYGTPAISSHFVSGGAAAGLLAEVLGTFVLMWAIMGVAVNPRGERAWAGWVIGGALALGVMTLGPIDGASFNPARWFGPAIVSGTWTDAWVYILGPFIGAIAAAFAYRAVVIDPVEHAPAPQVETPE